MQVRSLAWWGSAVWLVLVVCTGELFGGWTTPVFVVGPTPGGRFIYMSGNAVQAGQRVLIPCRQLMWDGTDVPSVASAHLRREGGVLLQPDTLAQCEWTEVGVVGGQPYLFWTYPAGPLPDGFERFKLVAAPIYGDSLGKVVVLADSLKGRFGAASCEGITYVLVGRTYYGIPSSEATMLLRIGRHGVQRSLLPQGDWEGPCVWCEDSSTVYAVGWAGFSVHYTLSQDGGREWKLPSIPAKHGGVQEPAVASLGRDSAVLLWLEDRTGDIWPDVIVSAWEEAGGWHEPVDLNAPLRWWFVVSARIHVWRTTVKARLKRLYVVWSETKDLWSDEGENYLAVFNGSRWSAKELISYAGTRLGNPVPVVDSRGIVYVFGSGFIDENTTGIYYTRSTSPITGVEAESDTREPVSFALLGAYPSPFNESTRVRYTLPRAARVSLRVLDVLGKPVRVLARGQQAPGEHTVRWDGRDDAGQSLPSGVYLIRLESGGQVATRKLVLVR